MAFLILALVIGAWLLNRLESLNFPPVEIAVCAPSGAAACTAPQAPLWQSYDAMLTAGGWQPFQAPDQCAFVADIMERHADDLDAQRVIDSLQARGVIALTQTGSGVVEMTPGPRNDSGWDVMADAVSWGPGAGCRANTAGPVFWIALFVWLAFVTLRIRRWMRRD
jgi:hypothetical protein